MKKQQKFNKWLNENIKKSFKIKSEICTKHTIIDKRTGKHIDSFIETGDTTFHK